MNEKVTMNWKLSMPWVADNRTCTARLINMDSAREYTITTTPTDGPVHELIGVLRAWAALIELHTGLPASDPMAYRAGRLS